MGQRPVRKKPPIATLQYGARLGDYIVNGFAGTGATSYVYRGRHANSFEPVAVKVVHKHLTDDPVRRAKFELEAQVMMGLSHPNAVKFYEVMEDADGACLRHGVY